MIGRGLFENTKVTLCGLASKDNASLEGTVIDMLGFEGVCFIAAAEGGEDADFTIKVQQGEESNLSDAADLEGTGDTFSTEDTPTHGLVLSEVYQPKERYVRAVVTAPDLSTAKYVALLAVQFGARTLPITNAGERHQSPAEGTA